MLHHLDGQVLTVRVRSSTAGRDDLWTTPAVLPLSLVLFDGPLPLATGGFVRAADHLNPAFVGEPGWLPPLRPGELLGLRLVAGRVHVEPVDGVPGTPEQHQAVRAILARHVRRERFFGDPEDENLGFDLVRALVRALCEDPDLLRKPMPPLDELTHQVREDATDFHWRDVAAWWGEDNVSFSVAGMPGGLHSELSNRARAYGMSFDQYVIAVLGHLAWRTPFAEDLGPWEQWEPAEPEPAAVRALFRR